MEQGGGSFQAHSCAVQGRQGDPPPTSSYSLVRRMSEEKWIISGISELWLCLLTVASLQGESWGHSPAHSCGCSAALEFHVQSSLDLSAWGGHQLSSPALAAPPAVTLTIPCIL